MKQFMKFSHAVWDCKYHVVWCPKCRLRILIGEVAKFASLKPFKKKDASFRASLTDKICMSLIML